MAAMLMLSVSAPITAEEQDRDHVISVITERMQDPQALAIAKQAGKDRSLLCASCHGVDGNSVKPDMPNLAGQNPSYIVEQIGMFADGRRRNFVMQALTRQFTFEDKVNLAIYFTTQEVKQVEYDQQMAQYGESLYKRSCFRCHGESGRGETGYARLAGQQIAYVEMTLKRYRGIANGTLQAEDARRSDPNMEQVTALLSDRDISSLAHYIAQLK